MRLLLQLIAAVVLFALSPLIMFIAADMWMNGGKRAVNRRY